MEERERASRRLSPPFDPPRNIVSVTETLFGDRDSRNSWPLVLPLMASLAFSGARRRKMMLVSRGA